MEVHCATPATTANSAKLFANAPAAAVSLFEKNAFRFVHRLAETGLFEIPRLVTCAEKLLAAGLGSRFVVRQAQAHVDSRFDQSPLREKIATAFNGLESSNAWVKLNNVADVDAEYRELLQQCIDEIECLSGRDIRSTLTLAQFTVFCASPGSVTPYHIDHETNFLCQIAGTKSACVWDPADRSVLHEEEIERFYAGEINAAKYRPEAASKGQLFDLTPGVGVHHPPLAPHLVKTGDEVAISVSINLCHESIDHRAHTYQTNHLLRKLGVTPRTPGRSGTRDRLKSLPFELLSRRSPLSAHDVVFSGLDRLRLPWYRLQGIRA